MTKIDQLVRLLATVDDHCANTFCSTCPYQQMSDEYPCSFYAIAQKLIDDGYDKVNRYNFSIYKAKKKTAVEEFAKKLKLNALKLNELECYHICNLIDELLDDCKMDKQKE